MSCLGPGLVVLGCRPIVPTDKRGTHLASQTASPPSLDTCTITDWQMADSKSTCTHLEHEQGPGR